MDFNHLHLYVDDVARWRGRLLGQWGAQAQEDGSNGAHQAIVWLGQVPVLISAPQEPEDAVATYLRQHPPGLGDLAFWVPDLDRALTPLLAHGSHPLTPITQARGGRWCQVQGWGNLRHTLVESAQPMTWVPGVEPRQEKGDQGVGQGHKPLMSHIDHGVINVPTGQMAAAVEWYGQRFGFRPQQQFTIHTPWSGLRSQVLAHPQGRIKLPINEPTTPNSQIQEFLDWNRGPGVQHVALHTHDIVYTVQRLRELGVAFLDVPESYYQALTQRSGYGTVQPPLEDWMRLKILVDWDSQTPQAKLLQTFTQPIFSMPTLFFEIIQRQTVWVEDRPLLAQGFGERNFQALFEAMEQEQRKRGGLA
ncbi:MAG: 4-hydroxyphenylpyruvate dioxygenase [Cyanobacteriota bacterium]|jgi:4-hydroxyphenylpyruvate dioxygenase